MKTIHYIMLACGAAAIGLPGLAASLPPVAAPYLTALHGALVFVAGVLGAVSAPINTPKEAA